MAEYILTTPTLVDAGSAVPFTTKVCPGNECYITHRAGSGLFTVKGGSCCHPAKYKVNFHGTLTGAAAQVTLGLYLDGELLPETTMAIVPAAAADIWSVDTVAELCLVGCCASIGVRVIEGENVTVNQATIVIEREVA